MLKNRLRIKPSGPCHPNFSLSQHGLQSYSSAVTTNPTQLLRTPLFEAHRKLGGKLIAFEGWEMPFQYTSIFDEHLAVRQNAGLFDISHMGEITVSGSAAPFFLNWVLTNDIRNLESGYGQYTLLCNERGGTIDDLYAYRLSGEVYLLIVNASRTQADVAWLHKWAAEFPDRDNLRLTDASHNYAAVSVQGPKVQEFIDRCIPGSSTSGTRVEHATDLKRNQIGGFPVDGSSVLISRSGYTGEDGFEIVGRDGSMLRIWDGLLREGQPFGIKPCGLGARDTLRTEVCYSRYGHELDEKTTPIEAGLGAFVALDKGEFIGRSVLAEQKSRGVRKKCVAFKMTDHSAPPRPHYPIWVNEMQVGEVVSGTPSPSLGVGIGLGYVPPELALPGTVLDIGIRGARAPAVVAAKPLYLNGLPGLDVTPVSEP
jgi:aminomethyltransferase